MTDEEGGGGRREVHRLDGRAFVYTAANRLPSFTGGDSNRSWLDHVRGSIPARISKSRRAIGLPFLVFGLLAAIAVRQFPDARFVLLAFAGTGLFIATLVFLITPQETVPASVFEQVYQSYVDVGASITTTFVYVPLALNDEGTDSDVRLVLPEGGEGAGPGGPDPNADLQLLEDGVSENRQVRPLGELFFREFESRLTVPFGSTPDEIATQLQDALENGWGLARKVEPNRRRDTEYTFDLVGPVCEPVDRFDHPIVSFLGVGFATGLNTPIRVTVTEPAEDSDCVITCTWEDEAETAADRDGEK